MKNRREILSEVNELIQSKDSCTTVVQFIEQRGKYNLNLGELSGNSNIGDTLNTLDTDLLLEIRSLLKDQHWGEEENSLNDLGNAIKEEVDARLGSALLRDIFQKEVLIQIEMDVQPNQVSPRWETNVISGSRPVKRISSITRILEEFDNSNGKLLILGRAGAGKTTTMLLLARELMCDRSKKRGIPVLLTCASWKSSKGTILDWLISELDYVYGIRSDVSKKWLNSNKLILLLDGFDELKFTHQEAFIQAINDFMTRTHRIVICSRKESYELIQPKLELEGAVYLNLLTKEKISNYLRKRGLEPQFFGVDSPNDISCFLQSPLAISLAVLVDYRLESNRQKINEMSIEHLCKAYVKAMLTRPTRNQNYRKRQAKHEENLKYLAWLARTMRKTEKTFFLIENLRTNSFTSDNQNIKYYLVSIFFGFLISAIVFLPISSKEMSLIFGLSISFQLCFTKNINPVETLALSWIRIRQGLRKGILFGMAYAIISMMMTIVLIDNFLIVLYLGAIACIAGGTFHVMYGGLRGPEIDLKKSANQGVKRSAFNALLVSLFCAALGMASGLLLGDHLTIEGYDRQFWTVFGLLTGGFSGWLVGGGLACIQHFCLRITLWSDKDIPWDYEKFLVYAADRRLLEKVGGRYKFIHNEIRDYFASLDYTSF